MVRSERVRRARNGLAALVASIGFVCFARVLSFGFAYDDDWTIVENRALGRSLGSVLKAAFVSGKAEIPADSTRPLMLISVWIDRHVFGLKPAGYHFDSLLWYALACALGSLALLALSRRFSVALAGGAFFALAPAHAEAVAAVNYREDLLAGAAVLALVLWLFSPRFKRENTLFACCSGLVWLAGLLAKENAVALVAMAGGVLALTMPDRDWYARRKPTLVALASVMLLWGTWRASVRLRGIDDVPLRASVDLGARVLDTARYEVRALESALWPFAWSPEYDPETRASMGWLVLLALVVLLAVVLARQKSTRSLAVGIALALGAALPTCPLLGPANARADRFLFLSLFGGALIWGSLADRLMALARVRVRGAALGVLSPLLVPMAFVSQHAAAAWKSDLTLWTVASEKAPSSFRSWVGLSRALRLSGDLAGAELAIERALELEPASLSAHVTRAYARLARGDVLGARADIQRVRELGGPRQRGLRRAAECAELEPDAARACIDTKD